MGFEVVDPKLRSRIFKPDLAKGEARFIIGKDRGMDLEFLGAFWVLQ